jgi:hypothetical protein
MKDDWLAQRSSRCRAPGTFVNGNSRRRVLKAGGTCLGMTFVPSIGRGQASDRDGLQRCIGQNAVLISPAPDRGGSLVLLGG